MLIPLIRRKDRNGPGIVTVLSAREERALSGESCWALICGMAIAEEVAPSKSPAMQEANRKGEGITGPRLTRKLTRMPTGKSSGGVYSSGRAYSTLP